MFFDPSQLQFVRALKANWRSILDELLALEAVDFAPWQQTSLYYLGWDVFGLHAFGSRISENCTRASLTTKIVERILELVTACFSSLKPNTHILPHVGYRFEVRSDGVLETRRELNSNVLHSYLGLFIPPSLTGVCCALRVRDQLGVWKEGECLCFDDTIEHEAWNRSQRTRVVLLIDFYRTENTSIKATQ